MQVKNVLLKHLNPICHSIMGKDPNTTFLIHLPKYSETRDCDPSKEIPLSLIAKKLIDNIGQFTIESHLMPFNDITATTTTTITTGNYSFQNNNNNNNNNNKHNISNSSDNIINSKQNTINSLNSLNSSFNFGGSTMPVVTPQTILGPPEPLPPASVTGKPASRESRQSRQSRQSRESRDQIDDNSMRNQCVNNRRGIRSSIGDKEDYRHKLIDIVSIKVAIDIISVFMDLYDKYINESGTFAINISSQARKNMIELLDSRHFLYTQMARLKKETSISRSITAHSLLSKLSNKLSNKLTSKVSDRNINSNNTNNNNHNNNINIPNDIQDDEDEYRESNDHNSNENDNENDNKNKTSTIAIAIAIPKSKHPTVESIASDDIIIVQEKEKEKEKENDDDDEDGIYDTPVISNKTETKEKENWNENDNSDELKQLANLNEIIGLNAYDRGISHSVQASGSISNNINMNINNNMNIDMNDDFLGFDDYLQRIRKDSVVKKQYTRNLQQLMQKNDETLLSNQFEKFLKQSDNVTEYELFCWLLTILFKNTEECIREVSSLMSHSFVRFRTKHDCFEKVAYLALQELNL